jgi:hypothetical protein
MSEVAKPGYVACACKRCGKSFFARIADRNRGWAKSCSKSCAATVSNKETGKFKRFFSSNNAR